MLTLDLKVTTVQDLKIFFTYLVEARNRSEELSLVMATELRDWLYNRQ